MRKRFFFMLLAGLWLTLSAAANEPDSVYLFAYNARPTDGLSFAYSADGRNWSRVGGGASFVRSDYGMWGREKRMYMPILSRRADGRWELMFRVNDSASEYGITSSPDLIHWKPQDYPALQDADAVRRLFDDAECKLYQTATVNGQIYQGCIHRVSFAEVEAMNRFQDATAYREHLYRETLADDANRFGFLNDRQQQATVTIDAAGRKAISDKLIGIFFEDINYSADGGIYAELVQNRDFEYSESDGAREAGWNAAHSWTTTGDGALFAIQTDAPVHPNQAHYAVLNTTSSGGAWSTRVMTVSPCIVARRMTSASSHVSWRVSPRPSSWSCETESA